MGLIRNKDLSLRLGEFPSNASATYYGGSGLALNSNGELVLAKANQVSLANGNTTKTTFLGLAWTTSAENATRRDLISTCLAGPSLVTLCKLTLNSFTNAAGTPGITGDDFPYKTTDTWLPGDEVYLGNDGLWTNTAATAADPYYGVVRAVSTDQLEVYFYGSPVYKD